MYGVAGWQLRQWAAQCEHLQEGRGCGQGIGEGFLEKAGLAEAWVARGQGRKPAEAARYNKREGSA